MRLTHFSYQVDFPTGFPPDWANYVDRWYQLDAPAFALAELFWLNRKSLMKFPEWIFLCSPGASNITDAEFARNPQPSPAKFVHTLPNIRSAALLQVMQWAGPVLCLQNDPNTILTGLREALTLSENGAGTVWVASVTGGAREPTAHLFVIDETGKLKIEKTALPVMANDMAHDNDWLSWILNKKSEPFRGSGLWIE